MISGPRRSRLSQSMPWFLLSLILCSSTVRAQSISTNTPIPPLQWINLTNLLSGTNPAPPLKDASIGYDDASRTLLIFGGESAQGFPQSQTFLLNLDTLIWGAPNSPTGLSDRPQARSAAISGGDYAANYRHAHIIIGGKGSNNQSLSDVWAFDYISQFWTQVNVRGQAPSARWGAAGGIDTRTSPIQDPVITGPNNTFYQAGGFDGKNALSDIWRLNVSGTLSANNPSSVSASWEKLSIQGTLPAKVNLGGTVVFQGSQQHIVAAGGCTSTSLSNSSCADPSAYVVNVDTRNQLSLQSCPAPRFGPALAPNANAQSTSFGSQVFLLLGTFDKSLWDDQGGLDNGEVVCRLDFHWNNRANPQFSKAILDINTGVWTRVLPAGDPGEDGGKPAFPSPREGAAAVSFHQGLVGNTVTRGVSSDTIVFGGRDASGNYLNDVWILRAYNGTITQSNQRWSGFKDGTLQTGVDADGEGVTVQYMTKCASSKVVPSQTGSPGATSSNTPDPSGTSQPSLASSYDTSVVHKILAPVSVALVLPAVFIYRLSTPSVVSPQLLEHRMALFYLSVIVAFAAFGVGIGGLASAFTSISYSGSLVKRSGSLNLTTAHGRAGLALFAGLYILVPVLFIISACTRRRSQNSEVGETSTTGRPRTNSNETAEKLGPYPNRVGSPLPTTNGILEDQAPSLPPEPRQPARSWNSLSPWPLSRGAGRRSSESALDAASSPSTLRSFEVTNRPTRVRHASANSLAALSDPRVPQPQRNFSDMSWRRSITTVGEIDYALTQLQSRGRHPSTPGTAMLESTSTRGLVVSNAADLHAPRMPSTFDIVVHILLHNFLLALCVLSLFALWVRGTTAGFAVFLVWTVIFYIGLFVLAWNGVPRESILTVIFGRLRAEPHAMPIPTSSPGPSRPLSDIGMDSIPFPSDSRGPYQHHQPPFRTAHDHEYPLSSHGHDMREVDDDDDDEDEESRQRRIEEEMSRRDVSIVTVPRRKLFLTNPEIS